MNKALLPSRETILKFARPSGTIIVPIEKNGAPVSTDGELNSQWMDITPAMAAHWLKNNYGNRSLSNAVVQSYARDMINGVWVATHQGVAFDTADKLIDGQHRLRAIVLSGKTIRMMVTFGLPVKIEGKEMTAMDCVDRGRPRSVSDQLKIQHGLANGSQIASICAALAHLCFGEKIRKLSVGQTLDIYRTFQKSVDFIIANRSKKTGLKSAGVLAAFAFVHDIKPETIESLFKKLMAGKDLEAHPVLKKLFEFLTGPQGTMIVSSLNRGIAEAVVHVLWTELNNPKATEMEMRPEEWSKAVGNFNAMQLDNVMKIARLFKLPVIEQPKIESAPEILTQFQSCECGKTYSGKKHHYGCPDCRKDYEVHLQTRSGVKIRANSDQALQEAVL